MRRAKEIVVIQEFPLVLSSLLLPVEHLAVISVQAAGKHITIAAASTRHAVACPLCHSGSTRIHSWYTRTLADLPCMGRTVAISLSVRRFFCDIAHCPRKIFAERFGAELPTFARRTARLLDALRALAFTAGGHGGARLAHTLSMPTSPRTLLRLMHAQPVPPAPVLRAVGLDEWAWKKGRNYGTLCVDLDRRQPVDLLLDRAPDSIAAWLQAHPTIEIITRDRSGGYTDGANRGAPQATQVADRWHLLRNLSEALERFFVHKRQLLKHTAQVMNEQARSAFHARPAPQNSSTAQTQASEVASVQRHVTYVELYHAIHNLHAKTVDVANIARQVGVSRRTVYRYLRMPAPPSRKQSVIRRVSYIEPYKPYMLQRWNDGCRSARQIYRELRAKGYQHGESSVQRYVHHLRIETGTRNKFRHALPAQHYTVATKAARPLTPLQVARVCLIRPEQRQSEHTRYLTALCEADAVIAQTYTQAQAFAALVRCQQGDQLDHWLAVVNDTGVPELRAFAHGLQKDYAAVRAGLTLCYSNGQTEAQIQRLKLLKRQMYGQAGFELLRKRVLHWELPLPVKRRVANLPNRLAA